VLPRCNKHWTPAFAGETASARHQQGAAIITALLVVMLAATIATYLLAQQSHALTRTARAADHAQVALYAEPTLDWARAVLAESAKQTYAHGKQPWAQGLNAQPLEGAIASGVIRDESAKFNLNNLVKDGAKSDADVKAFRELTKNLKITTDLAPALVDWLDKDSELFDNNGAEDSYYMALAEPYRAARVPLKQVAELSRVRGFDADTIKRLLPFVTALPARNKINLNTALPEVIRAYFPEIEPDAINGFVRVREETAFRELAEVKKHPAFAKAPTLDQVADINSQFFTVSIAITRESTQLRQLALLQRKTGTSGAAIGEWPDIIWLSSY
jgi:general secretion pathway protein K